MPLSRKIRRFLSAAAVTLAIAPLSAQATVVFGLGDINTMADSVNTVSRAPLGSAVPVRYYSEGGLTLLDSPGLATVDTVILSPGNPSWAPTGAGYTTLLRTDGEHFNFLSFSAASFQPQLFGPVDLFWRVRDLTSVLGSGEFASLTDTLQTLQLSTTDGASFLYVDLYATDPGGGFNPDHRTSNLGVFDNFRTTTGLIIGDDLRGPAFTGDAIPEPAAWSLLVGGFGLVGAALRRSRWAFRKAV